MSLRMVWSKAEVKDGTLKTQDMAEVKIGMRQVVALELSETWPSWELRWDKDEAKNDMRQGWG